MLSSWEMQEVSAKVSLTVYILQHTQEPVQRDYLMGAAHTSEASSNISQAQIDVKEFSPFLEICHPLI